MYKIKKMDIYLLQFIDKYFHCSILDKIMGFATFLGDMGLIWVVLSIILISKRNYRVFGIMTLCTLILCVFLGEVILKNLFRLSRPCSDLSDSELIIKKPLTYSFPSGHTASSFASAFILANINRNIGIYAFLLASLIAFSRVYLYVHYPTDIIGGIILGIICSSIVLYFFSHSYTSFETIKINTRQPILPYFL